MTKRQDFSGRLVALALAVVGLTVQPVLAHDMWIEPTGFVVQTGQAVGVQLRVGVDLVGEPLARYASLINQFITVDSLGPRPLPGRERGEPAGVLQTRTAGLHVVGYHSRASRVELPAAQFDAYLLEEGLNDIFAMRQTGAARYSGTREQFFRCAKSLVLTGPPSAADGDRTLGFPLELVAERNPYLTAATDELPIRLTFKGRPLAGALVVAMNRSEGIERIAVRSDSEGRVRMRLGQRGMWLIKAVHMEPAENAETQPEADWSSFWASLTFRRDDGVLPAGQ